MKQYLMGGACLIAAGLLATGCMFAPDYSNVAPHIPADPTISAEPIAPMAPVARPATPAPAAPQAAAASTRTDYSVPAHWLCRPGITNNACEVNIDATIVEADGSTMVEKFAGNPNAPIDCFYVYPRVSLDPFSQSDLVPGPEELNVVKAQLARLGKIHVTRAGLVKHQPDCVGALLRGDSTVRPWAAAFVRCVDGPKRHPSEFLHGYRSGRCLQRSVVRSWTAAGDGSVRRLEPRGAASVASIVRW